MIAAEVLLAVSLSVELAANATAGKRIEASVLRSIFLCLQENQLKERRYLQQANVLIYISTFYIIDNNRTALIDVDSTKTKKKKLT